MSEETLDRALVDYALRSQNTLQESLFSMNLIELRTAYEEECKGKRRKSLINALSARMHRVERQEERKALQRLPSHGPNPSGRAKAPATE